MDKSKQSPADTVAEMAPAESFGPLLTQMQVRHLLERTGLRLEGLERDAEILSVGSIEGAPLYPAVQFDEAGRPLPGLKTILRIFREFQIHSVTIASWIGAPNRSLGGESPASWLRQGGELRPVSEAAHASAGRFKR